MRYPVRSSSIQSEDELSRSKIGEELSRGLDRRRVVSWTRSEESCLVWRIEFVRRCGLDWRCVVSSGGFHSILCLNCISYGGLSSSGGVGSIGGVCLVSFGDIDLILSGDKVPTSFNQNYVDQLKAHIVKLNDIPEGVLVRSELSRVWRNLMCDPVLRHSDNTVMSIYGFLCMPSLDKATVRMEPNGLDTSILGRVADRTTSPSPASIVIPRASLEEIVVTRPDRKVVTKADHAVKRKASTGPKISTNAAKKTRSSKKRSRTEFAMEDNGNLNDVSQDTKVEAHAELSGDVRKATRARFYASHGVSEDASSPSQEAVSAPDTQPLDADAGADEIASDGNVDPYYEARVSNTAGDVLERDLLPFVPGPYYIPYPYDKGYGSESPPNTKDDWEEIHGVNLDLRKRKLYKD
nr:hypothetical protein [Tanacetum cinerariifolium]